LLPAPNGELPCEEAREELGVDLHTEYVGLNLRNPIILSPAGISETAKRMKRAEDAGCGAVVMKTLFQEEVTRRSPTPRFRVMRKRPGSEAAFVLYSYEQASPFAPKRYGEEIAKAKRMLSIPVIASIGCMDDDGWVEYARTVEEAGADAVEVNASCPHSSMILSDADVSAAMRRATEIVKEEVSIPVIPKMTPQAASPLQMALSLEESGADAVVMFNRFTGLEIDLDTEAPIMHGSFAGHGGPWSIHYLLRWLVSASPRLSIPISASGGIWSGEDVAKAILAGATTTQICTVVVVRGYGVISSIIKGLRIFMDRKGYSSLPEFRGNASDRVLSTGQVDRRKKIIAHIDPKRCTLCGICQDVCIYDSVQTVQDTFRVRRSCQGCGLCAELCPVSAISLEPLARRGTGSSI